MKILVVVTGLDQLSPADRWPRFIGPLADELAVSGLGDLPDLERLTHAVAESGAFEQSEVRVQLVRFDYGTEMIERLLHGAGINRVRAVLPEAWREYDCADYFDAAYCETGYWSDTAHFWYVQPFERIYENPELDFLIVGGAGADGIQWGYRRGHTGFWAYPVDGEFVLMSHSIDAFMRGWLAGDITL